jgi:RNA polymerase sigma factor (TIGR02999 family)
MTGENAQGITALLAAAGAHDVAALEQLWTTVYAALHSMAERQLAGDKLRHDHHPTTLVHEAYLRLVSAPGSVAWANRRHFFAAAAQAMRRIRVDAARSRDRMKRGGGAQCGSLGSSGEPELPSGSLGVIDELALDEALNALEALDPLKVQIVNCRYFAELTIDETAAALDLSPRTVTEEWRMARAWLYGKLTQA